MPADGVRWRPERGAGWRRRLVIAAAVAAMLAGTAIINRVLAPAEVLTPARTAYPDDVVRPATGVIGTLTAAPLIVDKRLRIYAAKRQVRADRPTDAASVRTPYWSYRRWPAQLTGIVAEDTTVVSRWSDNQLVALEAHTGRIAWRTGIPAGRRHGYDGRRTGAATVYTPPGLYTGRDRDGRAVVVVAEGTQLRGLDLVTGRVRWEAGLGGSCQSGGFTAATGYFVTVDECRSPHVIVFHDLATGAVAARWRPEPAGPVVDVAPVGCAIGRSGCSGMRTTSGGDSRGWLLDGKRPVAAPALDPAEAWLVGDVVVAAPGASRRSMTGWSARTGEELWRREVPDIQQVLAAQPGRVHLLSRARELVTLDAASGAVLSRFPLAYWRDPMDWSAGFVYASNGLVAVERLRQPVIPDADDPHYYLDIAPVILAGT
ncbi:MAG TPA: PQQ-binding-like beta-propeller repeat protein [Micromonosporaceae bacterium]|nr:PQQ-binding-like beta-propeller repeat protein [Micromonosporaceae bacterium]